MSFEPLVFPNIAPTLVSTDYFYPRQDAEILRRAMKGLGTDEKAIVSILAERTNQQRLAIAEEFKNTYDKDLVKSFRSELSGDFRDLVIAAMTPMSEYLARELNAALKATPPNLETLVEVLCLLCNTWLQDIRVAYKQLFDIPLEQAVQECSLPGILPQILTYISRGVRNENLKVDTEEVHVEAQSLSANREQLGTDASILAFLLATRSWLHLRRLFIEVEKLTDQPFDETIRQQFPEPAIEKGINSIVFALRDGPAFLANRLYASMVGLGTNERTLNRLILVRSELDLEDIKQEFVLQYKKSLASFVEGDTSGSYKRMLLSLVK